MSSNKILEYESDALQALVTVRPVWRTQRLASEALSLKPGVFLHAGPPYQSQEIIPKPVFNSICAAALYEGIAESPAEVENLLKNQEILLSPAQDSRVVVPLAGVVSSSMRLHEILDPLLDTSRVFAPINGGSGPAMRLGMFNEDVVAHLHWINGEFCEVLDKCLTHEINLLPIAIHALANGDDCHDHTPAATSRILQLLAGDISQYKKSYEFLQNSPGFFLNLWMAACKLMCLIASGYYKSSLVASAGANGIEMGIQVSHMPDLWFTAPAAPPQGNLGAFPQNRALGAIGDNAIVDACGFGAMAIEHSAHQKELLEQYLPPNWIGTASKILSTQHPEFRSINFRTGLLARNVVETNKSPIVSLGILDKEGVEGRLGGGIYEIPFQLFQEVTQNIPA